MKRALLMLLIALGVARAQDEPKVWVHAPAEDLLALFPDRGAGYLISIEEYRKLVALARKTEKERRERPPLAARLVHGLGSARLEDGLLRVEATYVALVKGNQPAEVPFPLHGIALESIDVEGGRFVGGSLRFAGPGTYNVTASLSVRLQKTGDIRKTSFRLPPAAGHTLAIDMPAGMEGEVGPIVRAFKTGDRRDAVVGYPDRNGTFTLWVRPRAEARQLEPLVSASFDSVATLGEANTITNTRLSVEVLRAPVRTLSLLLFKGQTVRGLRGPKIKTWRVVRGAQEDRLEIVFVEPVQGAQTIDLEAELPREEAASSTFEIPIVRLPNAVRYRGTVGIVARPEVKVTRIRAQGARRLDKLPKGRISMHEIWSSKPRITATVERIGSKTRAFTRALLVFSEGGKRLRVSFAYAITGKSLFRLEPHLPAGWILRQAVLDGRPVDHRYTGSGKLVMVFPTGLKPGRHLLSIALDTDEVDWLPNGQSARMAFAGLRSGLDEETGFFVVASDPAFRVSTEETTGLVKAGIPEVRAAGIPVNNRVLYAWRFDAPTYAATFRLERHRPQISAVVVNRVLPSERLLRSHATLLVKIERAGVRELKVALPKGTGRLVDFRGALIKEKRHPEEGADPEVWTLVFQKRMRGSYRLEVRFDRKFDRDAWSAPVPDIAVPDAQERGFVVVHSSATTAIRVERDGLREADVGELPGKLTRPPLEVLAYAKQPYAVTISSRRHDPHLVVQAIALSSHIYGVLTRDGRLRCRAEYRVRNNDQPFLAFRLPPNSTLIGALVDGEPAKPLVDRGRLKLPLARSHNREDTFGVALIYESRIEELGSSGAITIGRPELNIDTLKTRYTLHLPEGCKLTGHDGDLVPIDVEDEKTVLGDLAGLVLAGASRRDDHIAHAAAQPATSPAPAAAKPAPRTKSEAKSVLRESLKKTRGKVANKRKRSRQEKGARADQKAADKRPAPEEAAEEPVSTEDLDDIEKEDRAASADRPAVASKGRAAGRKFGYTVARGGRLRKQTPGGEGRPAPRRKRPDRALLSLDVQFLRPDNVYRLDSLAPTGTVTLNYGREEVFARRHYLGIVLGAALGLLVLLAGRFTLVRLVPAALLAILALHFAGGSFLSADFARGAATAVAVALLIALLPRLVRGLMSLRLPKRKTTAAALLLAAAAARAQEEVLVPYSGDDMDRVERVFLRADEYQRLRKLAYPAPTEHATSIASAAYAAELKGEVLSLTARYEIVKDSEAAERIPLRLDGVAVTSALVNGAPATLAIEKSGYVLVLKGKGRRVLELSMRPKLERAGAKRWFSIPVRPVAHATLKVVHDRSGHELEPIRLGAFSGGLYQIGPVALVGATWTPKTEGFRAAAAELRAQSEAVVSVRDGYTGLAARIRYTISGGRATRFRIRLDKSLVVRRVSCQQLAGWEITADGVLVVALSKPAERSQVIELFAERAQTRERDETFPAIVPLDVLRDSGVIALESLPDLKVELLESQGLLRGRAGRAPKELRAADDTGTLHSVYRFAVRPFKLRWRVFLEATRLRAETDLDLRVHAQSVDVIGRIKATVERGPGLFHLEVAIPADYEVLQASGSLRDWWVEDETLYLARLNRQTGTETYTLRLRRKGKTADAFEAPVLSVKGAVRESGLIRVSVADGLELEVRETSQLLPEDIAKVPPVRPEHLRRAYGFVTMPWRLLLATHEETREMEAIVVSRIVPLQDSVRIEALVNFYVRRGLVDELSFVVPVQGAETPLVRANDLREELSAEVEGGRRYTLRLRTPTRGSASAVVSYSLPYGQPLRGVEPQGVSRIQRYVAVEKVPDGEVKATALAHLDSGTFDDLPLHPPETTAQSVAAVFVGSGGAFGLDVSVKRHSFEQVAKAVIHRAAAQVVVDRSGYTRTVVTYRIYNRSEQFLELALPKQSRLYSVLVAGEGVRPLKKGSHLLVPLRKVAIGAPTFDVDVVYAYEGPRVSDEDFAVELPEVEHLDVRRTTLSLHLPKGFTYSFESEMKQVEEAELAAREANDIYTEIKELYSVAERGNALQSRRAFSNIKRLESDAKRLADKVQTVARSDETRQQVEAQSTVLAKLRKSSRETRRNKNQVRADKEQQRDAAQWEVNESYLKGNRTGDNRALEDFKEKQQARLRFVETASERAKQTDTGFVGPQGASAPGRGFSGGAGGGRGGFYAFDAGRVLDRLGAVSVAEGKQGGVTFGTIVADTNEADSDADFDAEVAQGAFLGKPIAGGLGLRGATGRISIRIDLPLEGEVYRFARLGAEGAVRVSADEEGGNWPQGLLALVCAGAAVLVLRYRTARTWA